MVAFIYHFFFVVGVLTIAFGLGYVVREVL